MPHPTTVVTDCQNAVDGRYQMDESFLSFLWGVVGTTHLEQQRRRHVGRMAKRRVSAITGSTISVGGTGAQGTIAVVEGISHGCGGCRCGMPMDDE